MVEIYLLPLGCLLLNFLAFAACLRFLFSRQGLYWIIPLALTLFMSWPHALTLYQVASDSSTRAGSPCWRQRMIFSKAARMAASW